MIGNARAIKEQVYKFGNLVCLVSVHVDYIKGTTRRQLAESLLALLNKLVCQCKAEGDSSLHICIQHEHSPPGCSLRIDDMLSIDVALLVGKDEDALCCVALRESYRSVLGAIACVVFTRADLAVYVQASQRRAHLPRINDCKIFNLVIRYMNRHKCGLKPIAPKRPLRLVGSID